MHLTIESATNLAQAVCVRAAKSSASAVTVGLAPAFVQVAAVRECTTKSPVLLGAQNCHAAPEGAYTGEVSAAMLADAGCAFVLAGHSERRQHHREEDLDVCEKAHSTIENGMHAVVCVGESLHQRESGVHLDVIEKQLRASLPRSFTRDTLTVSYEPIWAIGTGKTANTDNIAEVHGHIQAVLLDLSNSKAIPRVLYGGSVKANNALDILSLPVVDGVLVGGASLDANAFNAIIEAAETAAQKR